MNRTHIIFILPGAAESWHSVRVVFDPIDFKPLYAMSLKYGFEVLWPNDGKMQNFLLGLQNHSSRHPSPYSLFSQFVKHNQPHIVRTINTIISDNNRRIETGEASNKHHSVVAPPIQALIDHPNKMLIDVITIAPLHNGVLLVNSFIEMLARLNLQVASSFISSLPFTRDLQKGNALTGFACNHSHIILNSM